MKNKKIAIIITIVLISFIIMGLVYAVVTGKIEFFGKTTTGSVKIETINLSFTKQNGEKVETLQPADISNISWTTKNIGTSGILTRHTLEIYWENEVTESASNLLYLYPANMSEQEILADYENGIASKYAIQTEKLINNSGKNGIKYQFLGDTLDGTDMTGVSSEKNYNNSEFTITTDDNEKQSDAISYKLLLSPKTSYLYQEEKLKIIITTEALQYTEKGEENWVVVDTNEVQ